MKAHSPTPAYVAVVLLASLLVVMSLLLLIVPTYGLFFSVAVVATLIGILPFAVFMLDPFQIRLSWAYAGALLLSYAGGTVNSWASSSSVTAFTTTVAAGYTWTTLSEALALACSCAATMLLIGLIEPPLFQRDQLPKLSPVLQILVWVGVVVLLLAYLSGGVGLGGTQQVSRGNVSILGMMAETIMPSLLGVSGYLAGIPSQSVSSRRKAIVVIVCLLLAAIPFGRREFASDLMMAGIGFILGTNSLASIGTVVRRAGRLGAIKKLSILGLFVVLVYAAFNVFFAMRQASYELPKGAGVLDQASEAYKTLSSPERRANLGRSLKENVASRTFVLSYLADVAEAVRSREPAEGQVFLRALRLSTPKLFLPGKNGSRPQSVEELANPILHLPVTDDPNSFLTDGISDFGIAGAFIWPVLCICLLIGINLLMARWFSPIGMFAMSFLLLILAIQTEEETAAIFAGIRNLLIVSVCVLVLERIIRAFYAWVTETNHARQVKFATYRRSNFTKFGRNNSAGRILPRQSE